VKERGLFAKEDLPNRIDNPAGVCHSLGSLYEYQKKGDAGGGVCMSVKTNGIERRERGESFELDLITLVSVARVVLASQEI